MTRKNLCTWCGGPSPKAPDHDCGRPLGYKAQAIWPPRSDGVRGTSRTYSLTPLGWETAGYARVGDRWQKVVSSTTPPLK